MAQMNRTKNVVAMAGLLGGLILAAVPAFAQTTSPTTSPATHGGGMMNGMSNGQHGMMMNPKTMQKMSKMMGNCNQMMESMMQNKSGTDASFSSFPTNKG